MSRIGLLIAGLFALLILPSGCQKSPEEARRELNQLGIHWSQEVFLESVEDSDAVVVNLFLVAGMNPNGATSYGWTPLMHAALSGHAEIVKTLIEMGAEVNANGGEGFTALTLAAGSGRTDTLEVLLQAGAHVNTQDGDGWTALMYASGAGHTKIVKALLESHAEVNLQNNEGNTALALAELHGHKTIVEMLSQSGAVDREEPLITSAEPLHANLVPKAAMGQLQMGLKC
jgi:ankyrin repeat protein